jgi:hypothetical protein
MPTLPLTEGGCRCAQDNRSRADPSRRRATGKRSYLERRQAIGVLGLLTHPRGAQPPGHAPRPPRIPEVCATMSPRWVGHMAAWRYPRSWYCGRRRAAWGPRHSAIRLPFRRTCNAVCTSSRSSNYTRPACTPDDRGPSPRCRRRTATRSRRLCFSITSGDVMLKHNLPLLRKLRRDRRGPTDAP